MPASELLALADRWREDPARAAQDGQLLATTRAALASLDGAERATIARELRSHGAEDLAHRLAASERLPVWSDEVTAVARDLLNVDDGTLRDLRAAVDPDALAAAVPPPSGEPVTDLPPPPAPAVERAGGEVPAPDGSDLEPPQLAGGDALGDVDLSQLERSVRERGGWQPSAWTPRGRDPVAPDVASDPVAADAPRPDDGGGDDADGTWDDADGTWDDGGQATPTAGRDASAHAPGSGRRDADDRHAPLGPRDPGHRAPGQRDATRARDRFRALGEVADDADAEVDTAVAQLRDAPDGWQRRRVASRLIATHLPLDAEVVLPMLGRDGDRVAVADRLVRHGTSTVAEVTPWLSAAAADRIARRHRSG